MLIAMGSPNHSRPGAAMTLSFRLGSIPVRIHPLFLLMGGVLGLGAPLAPLAIATRGITFLLTVVVHELAHAVAARSFGLPAEVDLTLFRGGLGARIASLSSVRRVVVCLAGPAANLCAAAFVFAMLRAHSPAGQLGAGGWGYLGWLNLGWGVLNLLPILPLDGGHALVAALDPSTKGRGEEVVRCISIGPALALGCAALLGKLLFPALVCAVVAFQNVRAWGRAREQRNRDGIVRVRLTAAFAALERGEPAVAISHCCTVLRAPADFAVRNDAVRLLAYAYATSSKWGDLIELLESGGISALHEGELEKYQRAARELGRSEDARRIAFLRSHLV
jgi:stage IV sporulation protein FB